MTSPVHRHHHALRAGLPDGLLDAEDLLAVRRPSYWTTHGEEEESELRGGGVRAQGGGVGPQVGGGVRAQVGGGVRAQGRRSQSSGRRSQTSGRRSQSSRDESELRGGGVRAQVGGVRAHGEESDLG